ncbi:hypothetical protein PLESTB_001366400 [Pleodorina starrii]|uniref:G domain-containing protein n=1 Tax=Pleodorina starrii TaxID=330485 RepID=A0A9W6BUI0_9CHLO|nr:hypothetical protein PLESTM_000418600 [Pleodorina starrii]GLC58487.1 hypothetical protein PLESTB_001366400 [Pleodorina starrii]GLC74145.1 hypothetical protein PLESTF_001466600 [Pleodorina starrii]
MMQFHSVGALELRPDANLIRAAQAPRRSCVTFAAGTAPSGTGSGQWSKSSRRSEGAQFENPRGERGWGASGSRTGGTVGDSSSSRSAPQRGAQRAPNSNRAPERETGRFERSSEAGGREPFRPSSYNTAPSSRRSEQERAARKAARQADKAAAVSRNSQGCCYGCGAPLQTEVPVGAGYVAPDKYAVKKQHRQLDKVLCQRCSELCNGAMIPAVQDFSQKVQLRQLMGEAAPGPGTQAPAASSGPLTGGGDSSGSGRAATAAAAAVPTTATDGPNTAGADDAAESLLGKVLITPEQLRAQLTPLALRAAVVVLLVDLTDASGSLMARVRDMVGRNPIVMVGTKLDLLPQGCRPRDVAEWLGGAAAAKRLNVVSVHLVSSHTGDGMSAAVSRICRERKSRDVYVVGAANVGKSAFVRAMLKEMARTDPAAIGTGKYLPVESAMPGTTLGLIPLRAFSGGGILFDTPGVHLHHRVPHMLTPSELKLLHPRRRLSALVPPPPLELMEAAGSSGGDGADADPRVGEDDDDDDVASSSWGDSEGAVRRGRGGLKIVDYAPTDEFGMPITGLEAGVRRAGGRGEAGGGGRPAGRNGGGLTIVDAQQSVRATYMWSDLVRIDVLSGPPSTVLVFYGPSTMRAVGLPYSRPDQTLQLDYGADGSGRVLVCTESVALRGGLQSQELVVRANGATGNTALADVAVSGLPGWVSVWAPKAKKDVRLRVWVPRGVEVMARPTLPCPPPPALERVWRGERRRDGAEDDDDGEEPAALDEWSRALAAGVGDPTSDPAWWESMAALKDADLPGYGVAAAAGKGRGGKGAQAAASSGRTAGRRAAAGVIDEEGEEEDDDDLPDWEDEAEVLDEADDDDDAEGERVLVTARVEDILKRPRLDVLSQMNLELAGDAEEDEEEEEDDVSSFTLTKNAASRRRRDGPAADGAWDPLAGVAAAAVPPPAAQARRKSAAGTAAAASVRRRPVAAAGRSGDLAAAEGEQEEEVTEGAWADAELGEESDEDAAAGMARRGTVRRGRRRLGRRREVVQVAAEGDEERGEVA